MKHREKLDEIVNMLKLLTVKNDSIEVALMDKADKTVLDVSSDNLARVENSMDKLTQSIVDLKKEFSKSVEGIQAIEVRLDTKPDPNQPKPESRDLQLLEEVQQSLEHKVDLLRTNIDEPVALAVHDVLQQDKAEELEIEKRKTNVIIHGLAESRDDSSGQRISDDLAVLSAMFHETGVENAKVENVVRLGIEDHLIQLRIQGHQGP